MKRLLPFLLVLVSSATLAESGAYRVEVIVFRNLNAFVDTTLAEELRSFSQFPSLEETRIPAGLSEEPSDQLPETRRYDLPDDLNVITQKGTRMGNVWRRLRSSQGYRPLLYAAWEQNRVDYYPPMRIHDQQIIDTQLQLPAHVMVTDLAADDPLTAYRRNFYQLDGTVQLRRSRFLHLFLDLEYREAKPEPMIEPGLVSTSDTQTELVNGDNYHHVVFALKQNRQIRTDRMQYFDSPYFGALVFVSAVSAH